MSDSDMNSFLNKYFNKNGDPYFFPPSDEGHIVPFRPLGIVIKNAFKRMFGKPPEREIGFVSDIPGYRRVFRLDEMLEFMADYYDEVSRIPIVEISDTQERFKENYEKITSENSSAGLIEEVAYLAYLMPVDAIINKNIKYSTDEYLRGEKI